MISSTFSQVHERDEEMGALKGDQDLPSLTAGEECPVADLTPAPGWSATHPQGMLRALLVWL